MSIRGWANATSNAEGIAASLAVQALQTGKRAEHFIEKAGLRRALAHQLHAEADIIAPLASERWKTERKSGYWNQRMGEWEYRLVDL